MGIVGGIVFFVRALLSKRLTSSLLNRTSSGVAWAVWRGSSWP
jgi:hypothetical protein